MRLLERVRAAISSMRAPDSPLSANSREATSRMSRRVPSGSCMRTPWGRAGWGAILGTRLRSATAPLCRLAIRSEEHTSELQSLMRISYAVFCLKQKILNHHSTTHLLHRDSHD